jgi:hypothetical protein
MLWNGSTCRKGGDDLVNCRRLKGMVVSLLLLKFVAPGQANDRAAHHQGPLQQLADCARAPPSERPRFQ